MVSSRSKFPSRFSLHSTGSHDAETSGDTDNSRAMTNGRKFRMQIEAKYEKYRETYLATSPEQELQTINAGILNVRKWLRKRHTYSTSLSRSDSNRLTECAVVLKSLIAEAKKQQEGVDVLLDRGQRFLAVRANIVLEVDLENLVFLWNSYVGSLRKLQTSAALSCNIKESNSQAEIHTKVKGDSATSTTNLRTDSLDNLSFDKKQAGKEEISVELKDKDSNSGESSSSVDASPDVSFQDAGTLTLEDLNTTSTALDISDLVHDKHFQPAQENQFDPTILGIDDISPEAEKYTCLASEHEKGENAHNGSVSDPKSLLDLTAENYFSELVPIDQSGTSKMEIKVCDSHLSVLNPDFGDSKVSQKVRLSSSGDCPPSSESLEKEGIICGGQSKEIINQGFEASATFDGKVMDHMSKSESLSTMEMKRRRGLLEAPTTSNQSSRSESPLSLDSSRSETPTGTLKRAERQNELWRAIGSIDTFLMDKDIIEACKSTAGDLTSEDEDCGRTPNVSFAEFLQQYSELTDWLNQVHKVTQREVTSLSEKYLNQTYQEEMLERSPRREFLNNYSRQLLRRYPSLGDQVGARMARLNAQWAALERTIAPPHGGQHADTMLRDLESDLSTLRCWLNTIEARLLPLTIKADWSDSEIEQRLQTHKAVQRDIESHNKIVNAVLKLSERLASQGSEKSEAGRKSQKVVKEERERDSLQLVAINLQRRWHGIWLHSLEWQCRLEEALTRRKGLYQDGLDFSGYSLSVLDEALFGESSQKVSDQGLIELDDESLLFVGHRADFADLDDSRSQSASPSLHQDEFALWTPDTSDAEEVDAADSDSEFSPKGACGGSAFGATTPVGLSSPPRPIPPERTVADSPLGKRPYPDQTPGDASPAKRGSQSPLSSSGGTSPVSLDSPLDNFINSRGLCINKQQVDHGLLCPQVLRSSRLLFDRNSGDSANISECESKMGDSPPISLNPGSPSDAGACEGRDMPQNVPGVVKSEIKDIGYSSESQSNDEIEMMRHQIDMEYKFPGKCEVATDGPLGDKVMFPSVGVRPDYYCMTHVDVDSTTTSDVTDSSGERGSLEPARYNAKNKSDGKASDSLEDSWGKEGFNKQYAEDFEESPFLRSEACVSDEHSDEAAKNNTMVPMHQLADFSESDSAPEGGKKSIRYLIDHAEDLVKPSSPKSPSNSPKKSPLGQSSITLQSPLSPSKQTQTDTCSTVESSCDASGEDNSDHEQTTIKMQVTGEEFSTATDDADDTLFNSVINMESVSTPDPSKIKNFNGFTYPKLSSIYDPARLRKQTGDVSPINDTVEIRKTVHGVLLAFRRSLAKWNLLSPCLSQHPKVQLTVVIFTLTQIHLHPTHHSSCHPSHPHSPETSKPHSIFASHQLTKTCHCLDHAADTNNQIICP
ncbi:hypothetical protein EGW08_009200 [Elysia chlorotica]|uniref:KASH domain-containing protein n=1 Tax=Elysia chlorotica TaxID=188477 RepID=A0A3S1C4Y4_ELYCH|nr:hypothetical protein EGW08_009200 [Elysia chlorotica]